MTNWRWDMEVSYRLSIDDLDARFIESIKKLFNDKSTYINKKEDETDYLLSNPANASRLLKAVENIQKDKDRLIYKNIEDLKEC